MIHMISPFILRMIWNMKFYGNLSDIYQSSSADPVLESSIAELITLDINL